MSSAATPENGCTAKTAIPKGTFEHFGTHPKTNQHDSHRALEGTVAARPPVSSEALQARPRVSTRQLLAVGDATLLIFNMCYSWCFDNF